VTKQPPIQARADLGKITDVLLNCATFHHGVAHQRRTLTKTLVVCLETARVFGCGSIEHVSDCGSPKCFAPPLPGTLPPKSSQGSISDAMRFLCVGVRPFSNLARWLTPF
jgi:hypothetical protein